MNLEWDEAKNRANIRKHGLDFVDAEETFRGVLVVDPGTREEYGEKPGLELARFADAPRTWSLRNPARTPFASSHRERQLVVKINTTKRRSRTDWKRVDALRDEDIDFSEMPELGPDFFARAILWPGPKKQITLRLDPDVLAFFRKSGKGYQTTINAILRKYVEVVKSRRS